MCKQAHFSDKETASGRLIDLLCPEPGDVLIDDIATSLAYQNRFDGHARVHYSVAQHSVLVANLLDQEDRIHGILHDAPEFLIGDLSSPMKAALKHICPDFRRAWHWIEAAAEKAIYDSLGVPLPTDEQRQRVKRADLIALATEQRDIMRSPNLWNLPFPADPRSINALSADSAKGLFVACLAECMTQFDPDFRWAA